MITIYSYKGMDMDFEMKTTALESEEILVVEVSKDYLEMNK